MSRWRCGFVRRSGSGWNGRLAMVRWAERVMVAAYIAGVAWLTVHVL